MNDVMRSLNACIFPWPLLEAMWLGVKQRRAIYQETKNYIVVD